MPPSKSTWEADVIVMDLTGASVVEEVADHEEDIGSVESEVCKTFDSECFHDGRVVIYTDGATRHNQHKDLRRAGSGGFWSHRNPKNFSKALPGLVQTNQRAELYAVWHALEVEARDLEIRSDSQYVVDGCIMHLRTWQRRGWRSRKGPLINSDLWQKIYQLLQSRRANSVKFCKVKGHASWDEVEQGSVSHNDKIGNDMADALAVAGASLHQ
eukprot:5570592-Karenia_brevis.AAC.1